MATESAKKDDSSSHNDITPIGTVVRWVFGRQDSTATVLILLSCAMAYAFYWAATNLSDFARSEIPKHIQAIQSGYDRMEKNHIEAYSRLVQESIKAAKDRDDHYSELRKIDEAHMSELRKLMLMQASKQEQPASNPPPEKSL